MDDWSELRHVEPAYRVFLSDNTPLALTADMAVMREQLEALEPGCFHRFLAYMEEARINFEKGFASRPFQSSDNSIWVLRTSHHSALMRGRQKPSHGHTQACLRRHASPFAANILHEPPSVWAARTLVARALLAHSVLLHRPWLMADALALGWGLNRRLCCDSIGLADLAGRLGDWSTLRAHGHERVQTAAEGGRDTKHLKPAFVSHGQERGCTGRQEKNERIASLLSKIRIKDLTSFQIANYGMKERG
jgi:hypothetical protein